jgi:hypothetical protein
MVDNILENHFQKLTFRFCQEIIQSWKTFRFLAFYTFGQTLSNGMLERSSFVLCKEWEELSSLAQKGLVY